MNIAINILELAFELADRKLIDIQKESNFTYFPNGIVKEDENEIVIYTEEAQESFNHWYDYFYSIIEKYKI